MAFKIKLTGVNQILTIIKTAKRFEKRMKRIINGLNWYNITKKIQKSVRSEMKSADYNTEGTRGSKFIAGFGVDKVSGVNTSKGKYSKSFNVHKPIGEDAIMFEHRSWKRSLPAVSSDLLYNFMAVGHTRKGYTIPTTAGTGRLKFLNRRAGPKFVMLPKAKLWNVPPVSGRADFDSAIHNVMSDWFDDIAEKCDRIMNDV